MRCETNPTVEGSGMTVRLEKGGALHGTHLKLIGHNNGGHSNAHQSLRSSVSPELGLQRVQVNSSQQVRHSSGQNSQILSFFKFPNFPSGHQSIHLYNSR